MQKTSMKINSMTASVSGLKPPKPPCWRDFVKHNKKENCSTKLDISDCNKLVNNKSVPGPIVVDSNKGSGIPRPIKRVRAKIHRTRSEHCIQVSDLPDNMAGNSPNSRPKQYGLRKQFLGDRLCKEENSKRCQSWLQSIEACEPLDEIKYTQCNETDSDSVEIEIPEEGGWHGDCMDIKAPHNTSGSDDDHNMWWTKHRTNPSNEQVLNVTKDLINDKLLLVDTGGGLE